MSTALVILTLILSIALLIDIPNIVIEIQHDPNICPEWSDPHGSSFSVSYEDILKKMGKSKSDISLSIKQINEHNSIQSMFA
jgi:hypothetical protein